MAVKTISDLLQEQVKDLYSAETQIIEALPELVEAAREEQLRNVLEEHLEETRRQKERLEEVSELCGFDLSGAHCEGIAGILEEGEELLREEVEDDQVLDAAIIASAQRTEHYEIASYGTARSLARELGQREAAELLEETLEEEKQADANLTRIAEESANRRAEEAGAPGEGGGTAEDRTKEELYREAQAKGVEGRSDMSKEELAREVEKA